jgi:hypothetical protein
VLLSHRRVLLYHLDSTTICSVDAIVANQNDDGWTTIIDKHKKNGQKGKETRKEDKSLHGGNEVTTWD